MSNNSIRIFNLNCRGKGHMHNNKKEPLNSLDIKIPYERILSHFNTPNSSIVINATGVFR